MTLSLEQRAVLALIEKAEKMGLDIPESVLDIAIGMGHRAANPAARAWAEAHPESETDGPFGCCQQNDVDGAAYCLCWQPVYDLPQQPLLTDGVGSWQDCPVRKRMCGDCAYRPGSPERTENGGWKEESLLDLARSGKDVFFCHAGVKRPVKWVHPDGREVPGDPADYHAAFDGNGVGYRADGRPALVCAGFAQEKAEFLQLVQPDWLMQLCDLNQEGVFPPGHMVWQDPPPRGVNRHGRHGKGHAPLNGGPPPPSIRTRHRQFLMMKDFPEKWARVLVSSYNHASALAKWFRRHQPGDSVEAVVRRTGDMVGTYVRYLPQDVLGD